MQSLHFFFQGNFIEKFDPTIEDLYHKQCEIDNEAALLNSKFTIENKRKWLAVEHRDNEYYIQINIVMTTPKVQKQDRDDTYKNPYIHK